MTGEQRGDSEKCPRMSVKKNATGRVYFVVGCDTPEDFQYVLCTLREKGVATDIRELFSPYSSIATVTIVGCDVVVEYDSIGGGYFHIKNGRDSAALEMIAGAIERALT